MPLLGLATAMGLMAELINKKGIINMKQIILVLSFVLAFSFQAFADNGTLGSPLQVQPTEAISLDWDFNLGTSQNAVTGRHRWKAAGGRIINLPESGKGGWIRWSLKNYQVDPIPAVNNSDCTATGVPDVCCADADPDPGNTCDDLVAMPNSACVAEGDPVSCCQDEDVGVCQGWSDTALFDCGPSACDDYIIGVGLRALIMQQWKLSLIHI